MKFHQVGIVAAGLVFMSGCNPYTGLDTPSGDAQILAAARACFDKGDYTCASKYYGLLSTASSDQTTAEAAFQILAQNGATFGVFMQAALTAGSSGGKFINKIGGSLTSVASETTRLAIFHAYQKYSSIVDTKSQGLLRFVTAATLAAELLAENATTSGKILQTDLVTTPSTCLAAAPTYQVSACNAPSGSKLALGTSVTLTSATDAQMSGSPTLFMINAALSEVNTGITQMGSTGGLGSSSSSFATQLLNVAPTGLTDAQNRIYRGTLIKYDIGE